MAAHTVKGRTPKTPKEVCGIWKLGVRCLSIMLACITGKEYWLTLMAITMPLAHKGRNLISVLNSSTCWTEQRFQDFKARPSNSKSLSLL